ncbi:MAG TPA: hypothetical protein PKA39_11630, partial [Ignavibacteria bacterium]|nr:hypothetical protein [Ignavibacteria bacterium]
SLRAQITKIASKNDLDLLTEVCVCIRVIIEEMVLSFVFLPSISSNSIFSSVWDVLRQSVRNLHSENERASLTGSNI